VVAVFNEEKKKEVEESNRQVKEKLGKAFELLNRKNY